MKTGKPFVIGLTGSIGMGKSTVADMFAEEGVAIWDADAAVHKLYGPDQPGARAIAELVPEAVGPTGVDRRKLSAAIASDPGLLRKIELAIHPLVAADRRAFLKTCRTDVALLDIPLLFESNDVSGFDLVVVASANETTQRARVLERPGMTPQKLDMILAKQLPDARKRALADVVIMTDTSLEQTRGAVKTLVQDIRGRLP